ncbi:MAG: ABC transporter permease, partial [Armatimonadota bacterium]
MASEQPGTVQRQISLPWSQAFKISIRNVTLRLGRAAITAAGIVLVIGLLAAILTGREAEKAIEEAQRARGRIAVEDELPAASLTEEQGPGVAEEKGAAKGARQWWLIGMSLLVCVVGIINSMLMSVTERFREIGTMKCL